jgi:tetratricopeptide (TPR) repeat protein
LPALAAGLLWFTFRFIVVRSGSGRDGTLYVHAGSDWQTAPDLHGAPDEIRVSPAGVVWVSTWDEAGLYRVEGQDWRRFDEDDLGGAALYDLNLAGEEVWGANRKGVVHYDGADWQFYAGVLATDRPASIAAGATGVWVADKWGHLDHFDGTHWTRTDLGKTLPQANWGGRFALSRPSPELALAADGFLWLAHKGLWRFDGASWTEMRPGGERADGADLLLADATGVWVWADGLWWWDGSAWHGSAETLAAWPGFPAGARVYGVGRQGRQVATGEGIFQVVGENWEPLPLPTGTSSRVRKLAVSGAATWAILEAKKTFWETATSTISRLAFYAALIAVGSLVLGRLSKDTPSRERERPLDQLAPHGPPPVKEAPLLPRALRNFWRVFLENLIPLALAFVIIVALRPFLKDAPGWLVGFVGALVFWVVPAMARWLWARIRGQSAPRRPAGRAAWATSPAGVLILVFTIGLMLGFLWLMDWLTATGRPPYLAFIFLLPLNFILFIFLMGPRHWVNAAVKRDDYETALRRLGFLEKVWRSQTETDYAPVLILAGRHAEAEARLRAALDAPDDSEQIHLFGELRQKTLQAWLGHALLEQARYEEALHTLARAAKKSAGMQFPGDFHTYNGLAEVYLRQGIEPGRALELLEYTLAQKSGASKEYIPFTLANRAWALASMGCHAEAGESLAEAFKKADRKHKPHLAGLFYRAGQVARLRCDKEAAREHFGRAWRLDPRGNYGRLAARARKEV